MMESYRSFAQVYDLFMDNIDYDAWSRYVSGLLRSFGITEGLVLELGCGTGSMTQLLAESGYDMIGVDNSEDMLEIAMNKKLDTGFDILYLQQDMRGFELYGTVQAVISVCDSMNYLLSEEELLQVFCLVNNYLDPGGVFIFDMNTIYKYEMLMADNTFAENREEGSFIWDNCYDSQEKINEYQLTIFLPEEDGLYRKYEELHLQKGYPQETVQRLIETSGMEFAGAYDAFTSAAPGKSSERICYIARECLK